MAKTKKSFLQKNGLVAVWSAAGIFASSYIAFLILGMPPLPFGGPHLAQTSSVTPGNASAPANAEMASLRAQVVQLEERGRETAEKLSKMEQSFGPVTVTSSISGTKPTGYGIDEEPEPGPATQLPPAQTNVAVTMAPLPQDDRLAEVYSQAGFDSYGLSLATARSIEALERHWDYLTKTAANELASLQPRYVRKGPDDNPQFELIAGPLERLSDAQARCQQLTRHDIDCRDARFNQNAGDEFESARHDSGK